jgi:hypothetical protein
VGHIVDVPHDILLVPAVTLSRPLEDFDAIANIDDHRGFNRLAGSLYL